MTKPTANPAANPAANSAADAQSFLAPLARLAARHPGLEGQVLWAAAVQDGWQVQDDTAEMLDAEEIPFYVEGLLVEGFSLLWQAMAEAGDHSPDHILLMVSEPGAVPPAAPEPAEGWVILASGRWDGTRHPQSGITIKP